ncbi:hypothetical protein WA026_012887 [Henosepilachna vigintioctopunctata]|uniref:Ubiquitin carboxyl-terminal hydrolase n=1 Tax=Henosepilachna vigintioctopunctata TaxID=420089 RepID=A0AAW1TUW0_9CUCU
MPASTFDAISGALRASLSKNNSENVLESQIAGSTKKALLANIEFESAGTFQNTLLDSLKSKYIVLKRDSVKTSINPEVNDAEENLKLPKYELFPIESVQLGWSKYGEWKAGCGMINMGNTCYLNSTLQALFHVPALVNWLMSDKEHTAGCYESGGLCIICSMRKTLLESQNANMNAIRPLYIYNKLRFICRNFILGRQEDAHEFLRHLVEAMEKAYLSRFKNHSQLDAKVKETTPLNQIFGGYLKSSVHCLECGHISTTFQHFQDLLLDIRKSQTLEEALDGYFSREKLDDESYLCESCRKKVSATKQFSIERAPIVLCVQLKRFSVSNTKITKHITFRQRLDLTKFARSRPANPLVYKLVSLVTHMGPTVNCGHYTAVGLSPSGNYYQFDDSAVRPISYQGVFTTNAYILMYELESPPFHQKNSCVLHRTPVLNSPSSTEQSCSKAKTPPKVMKYTSSIAYGPHLPPNIQNKTNGEISTPVSGAYPSDDDSDNENKETSKIRIGDKVLPNENGRKNKSDLNKTDDQMVPVKSESRVIPFSPPFDNDVSFSKVNSSKKELGKSTSVTKLVPYDADDSSNSEDSSPLVNTMSEKTTSDTVNGKWNVTTTADRSYEPSSVGKSWTKNKSQSDKIVKELYRMSHNGYSAPVSTWNGTRAHLDKEVINERREERKRSLAEISDSEDHGRTKHIKSHNNYTTKSNPGFNIVQEIQRTKNWNRHHNGTRYNKQFHHVNKHRHKYAHKNYHNKNFHYRP